MALAQKNTILIIGDSLSAGYGINLKQGWVYLLQKRLDKNNYPYRIINSSISGDTSSNGLIRLPKTLIKYKPQIVIIELGGNDGLRGISAKTMQSNLNQLVNKALDAKAKVLLIGVRLPPNYGATFIKQFATVYKDVAKTHQVLLVPQFLKNVGTNLQLMQKDGIHPNAKAQQQLLDNVWPQLQKLLGR
jgi:acyl-CoA thioesterase I